MAMSISQKAPYFANREEMHRSMEKNREKNSAAGKLSDEALSQQLGRLQRVETSFSVLCVVSVIACALVLLVWQEKIAGCVLLAIGVASGLIFGSAQKRKKTLLNAQLGDFYRAELERAFGPEGHSPELRIDEAWLRTSKLVDRLWEKSEIRDFREGVYRGVRFSAANVTLNHSYEHRSGQDMVTEITEMLDGVVVRCKAADGTLTIHERVEEHPCGDLSDPAAFAARYTVCGGDGADAEASPTLREMLKELERLTAGEVESVLLRDGTLSVALNTKYAFADVPAQMDMRDIGAVRKWYTATLQGMCRILDALLKSGLPAAE